jgi:inorganic pyrophosphatase
MTTPPPDLHRLPAWHGRLANVVIETPKGQANKLKFDPALGTMRLGRVLPLGMVFPFDFGFLPSTKAPDGDPLDVLVLMDAPVVPGCVVETHIIGVLRCQQREGRGQPVRNDRLIGVAAAATTTTARSLRDIDADLLRQIEAFFVEYHRIEGRTFEVLRREGAAAAVAAARQAAVR